MKWMVVALLLFETSVEAEDDYTTYDEASGFKETPRYDETVEYCKTIDRASQWLKYTTFGKTPQGRDLPLLVADGDGQFSPDKVRRDDKVVLLVQACIHPGESDGKDAGLMLLRDIAVTKKYPDLLDHVTILFIPILNVDGHERFGPFNRINQNGPKEMGWRVTAQNLNL
ncbi:MAG: peptidase M14, partial [Candidatus Krumholzibacteria bacterium]|nr:peptidase M14 [Candidatus Krumholzibacteria bacterium]